MPQFLTVPWSFQEIKTTSQFYLPGLCIFSLNFFIFTIHSYHTLTISLIITTFYHKSEFTALSPHQPKTEIICSARQMPLLSHYLHTASRMDVVLYEEFTPHACRQARAEYRQIFLYILFTTHLTLLLNFNAYVLYRSAASGSSPLPSSRSRSRIDSDSSCSSSPSDQPSTSASAHSNDPLPPRTSTLNSNCNQYLNFYVYRWVPVQ